MPAEAPLFVLVAKMALTAAIVVVASVLAERSRPLIAAMIATLPISVGPIYAFLALEHDAAFMSAAALGSISSNMATVAYCLSHVFVAQRARTLPSLLAALAAWAGSIVAFKALALPLLPAAALTALVFGGATWLVRPYLAAVPKTPPVRLWYAIPLRATAVAALVGAVTTISNGVGPVWSGMLATAPIVLSSLIAILQPRLGGPAMAALMGNSIAGLFGLGLALMFLHLAAVPLGSAIALTIGLAICVAWNLMLVWWSSRRARRA